MTNENTDGRHLNNGRRSTKVEEKSLPHPCPARRCQGSGYRPVGPQVKQITDDQGENWIQFYTNI